MAYFRADPSQSVRIIIASVFDVRIIAAIVGNLRENSEKEVLVGNSHFSNSDEKWPTSIEFAKRFFA